METRARQTDDLYQSCNRSPGRPGQPSHGLIVLNRVLPPKPPRQVHTTRRLNETRGARPKHNLATEDFFELFNSGIPQVRIAELTGLSRERIRQIYNRDFRDLFGGESGRKRFSAYVLNKRHVQAKERQRKIFAELHPIMARARAAGCTVNFIWRKEDHNSIREIEPRLLAINGHQCLIYPSVSRAAFQGKGRKRRYVSVDVSYDSLLAVQAVVIRTAVKRQPEYIFVIPSKVVLKAYFCGFRETARLYLPTVKIPPYNNQFPRIEHWIHERAWHLLPPKHAPSRLT
jgi:hypothetical protein